MDAAALIRAIYDVGPDGRWVNATDVASRLSRSLDEVRSHEATAVGLRGYIEVSDSGVEGLRSRLGTGLPGYRGRSA
jgi:hypothetical protein